MLKRLAAIVRHQASNIVRLSTGEPVSPIPFGSMTLDQDDVDIALMYISNREKWTDDEAVSQFEMAFADYCGAREAVSFKSGRVAFSATLNALEVGSGDEVIVPGYTCVVVPNAIKFTGAKPVYCDIELETYGPSADSIRDLITDKTKAIVVQHLYGLVCRDYIQIIELAADRGILVVEDCAHAIGATFRGLSVGLRGDAAFFSTEQSKVINSTYGGVAVSRRPEVAEALRRYQLESPWPDPAEVRSALESVVWNYYRFKHPQRWWRGDVARLRYGRNPFVATNSQEMAGVKPQHYRGRMSAAIASVAKNQLTKVEHYNEKRRANALRWDSWCDKYGFTRPVVVEESQPVFLRYPVLADATMKRDPQQVYKRYSVVPGVWFASNQHPSEQPVSGCPNADTAVSRCINLPCLIDDD